MKKSKVLILLLLLNLSRNIEAQEIADDLSLEDPEDMKVLLEDIEGEKGLESDETKKEGALSDDLQSLKDDLGNVEFMLPSEIEAEKKLSDEMNQKAEAEGKKESKAKSGVIVNDNMNPNMEGSGVFDVGQEEKELLSMAEKMQGQIPVNEWNELINAQNVSTYTVRPNDWLWKISKKFFGSGFYYAKIWSLNPYITNPHLIEPGMILSFTTGTEDQLPEIKVGEFSEEEINQGPGSEINHDEYGQWGDNVKPGWVDEKKKLQEEGVYVQYSTDKTQEDLDRAAERGLVTEYENYEPPRSGFSVDIPKNAYDATGFDKSRISFKFKEGFDLNTFVSTNIVQDFGKIDSSINEGIFLSKNDHVYVKFDDRIDVVPGDRFSIYSAGGKVEQKNSDRSGYKYTIEGHIQTVSKHGDLWECEITNSNGVIERGYRVTVYTPRIERITQSFNSRTIEGTVMGSYSGIQKHFGLGDVVYLDRGRADGVEMGNVFEAYGFQDRATKKNITENPTYKNGELTVITLTDNYATALVTLSVRDFYLGDVVITKTKEAAARATRIKDRRSKGENERLKTEALDELDVELNLDGLNDSLLDKADKIQFTEDELAELERQEREKSVMTEGERDLRSLERLEKEIETAEKLLNEAKLDEDKLLEAQDMNDVEKKLLYQEQESLEEIEENYGKRFMDEDLNNKDNPYGLTEYDLEEIDELLNTDKDVIKKEKDFEEEQQMETPEAPPGPTDPKPFVDDVKVDSTEKLEAPDVVPAEEMESTQGSTPSDSEAESLESEL